MPKKSRLTKVLIKSRPKFSNKELNEDQKKSNHNIEVPKTQNVMRTTNAGQASSLIHVETT